MKVAIDYDGVIINHTTVPTRKEWWLDYPHEHVREVLNHWIKSHEVYICTARPRKDWKKIREWLRWHNLPNLRITNMKEMGTQLYIDDRAYRFDSWLNLSKLI